MKRFTAILLALLLLAPCALAQQERTVVAYITDLLDAPHADAQTLMRYYVGTQVEVVRDAGADYVQVTVGNEGGSLMGYMAKEDLAIGEIAARAVRPDIVECYADWQPCALYSAPDTLSGVIDRGFYVEGAAVLGYLHEQWLHVQSEYGGTGFVSLEGLDARMEHRQAYTVEVEPMETELSLEEAIEEGKRRLLADYESGANRNMGMGELTREGLDACVVEARACVYVGYPYLHYELGFRDPDSGDFYAWINLDVEGMQVLSHNYGNG